MACPIPRKYPPKQPPHWKPPVPRWQLSFPPSPNSTAAPITAIHTIYVGIQSHTNPSPSPTDNPDPSLLATATASIIAWLKHTSPAASDAFITETTLAHDLPGSRVWVAYFTDREAFESALSSLDLVGKYHSLVTDNPNSSSSPQQQDGHAPPSAIPIPIGFWAESFTTPLERLETNYAGLHERPGLAGIEGTEREGHELSAYWGAARDRIPASAGDLFEVPGSVVPTMEGEGEVEVVGNGKGEGRREVNGVNENPDDKAEPNANGDGNENKKPPSKSKPPPHITDSLSTTSPLPEIQYPLPSAIPRGYGQRLTGTNYDNMTHIRSGQCWTQCPADEAAAYTRPGGLQEKLMGGMEYLWGNARETGTLGLRWLRNVREEDQEEGVNGHVDGHANGHVNGSTTGVKTINETCGAGFFRNLKDLENWSSTHPSHMAIFTGAHKHAREWGPERKFMTWHEVSVLKRGEARWEYVNCDPRTGVVRFVQMDGLVKL